MRTMLFIALLATALFATPKDSNLSVDDIIVVYKDTLTIGQLEELEELLAKFEDSNITKGKK